MDSRTEPDDDENSSPNWLELPREITASILSRIGTIDILNNAQLVCESWRSICREPSMWRRIDMCSFELDLDFDLDVMCRHAVDLSCGGLVDINIEYFGTNELLKYIAGRADNVKRLRIVQCYGILDEGFSAAIAKFPLLEDLELSYCQNISKDGVEAAGRSCPLLKSFKLNNQGCKGLDVESNDEEALAIAETMPGLRHLQIFGNNLTNDGLHAILDGCPRLESLDLRQCFNVNLDGPLGKRCAERLKDFRRIYDSTDDYPFGDSIGHFGGGGTSEEDYPSGFSDIDLLSDYDLDLDDYYEFSDGSDFSGFYIY